MQFQNELFLVRIIRDVALYTTAYAWQKNPTEVPT